MHPSCHVAAAEARIQGRDAKLKSCSKGEKTLATAIERQWVIQSDAGPIGCGNHRVGITGRRLSPGNNIMVSTKLKKSESNRLKEAANASCPKPSGRQAIQQHANEAWAGVTADPESVVDQPGRVQ